MYKTAPFFLFVLLAFACDNNSMSSNNKMSTPEELVGEWTLEGIESANPAMQDSSFDDMDYSESYSFKDDGTFVKSRQDGATAEGTVSVRETEEGDYYILSYGSDAPMELLSSCQSGEESLKIEGEKLINDSRMCDRPRYTYSRSENEK